MTNERQDALCKLANDVLKAHVRMCDKGGPFLFEIANPNFWVSPERPFAKPSAQHFADNPSELERIRAEIEAEREPKHAFPDDDADLEGEMYEDEDGEVMMVASRSHHKPDTFYCIGDKGAWVWPTASKIRKHKPLGPSPRKQIEQARKRVVEVARHEVREIAKQGYYLYGNVEQALADLEKLEAGE